jgi:hypothetical protein
MAAHPNRHVSAESAARSPLACYLRRRAPQGTLFAVFTEDIAREMGYSKRNPREVVIAMLRELKELRVIDYVAELGPHATVTIRVLM